MALNKTPAEQLLADLKAAADGWGAEAEYWQAREAKRERDIREILKCLFGQPK